MQLKWTNLQYEERGHGDVQMGEWDVVADAALHSGGSGVPRFRIYF